MFNSVKKIYTRFRKWSFLFTELVKRDFKQKYKGTVLGMGWSVLSPLMTLFVMRLVFIEFYGRNTPHYTTYLFCGTMVYNCFKESTKSGMNSLMSNHRIMEKINLPKYMFLLSKNVSSLINFGLTLIVFFIFALIDRITFGPHFIALIYPIVCLLIFNIGVGLILSALYVFFRDTSYLYDIFTLLLHYLSAIFYSLDKFSPTVQKVFLLNPVFCYIKYFRLVTIDGTIPSIAYHALCALYPLAAMGLGLWIYKKNNHKFLYYM